MGDGGVGGATLARAGGAWASSPERSRNTRGDSRVARRAPIISTNAAATGQAISWRARGPRRIGKASLRAVRSRAMASGG